MGCHRHRRAGDAAWGGWGGGDGATYRRPATGCGHGGRHRAGGGGKAAGASGRRRA